MTRNAKSEADKTVKLDGVVEIAGLEEDANPGRPPPRARRHRTRIDKQHRIVEVSAVAGRELPTLAGQTPATGYMISQKPRGGEARKVGDGERGDFERPHHPEKNHERDVNDSGRNDLQL